MNIQLQLQPISDNINIIEMYLQELELIVLNSMGSEKFKWTDFKDIKRKSSITDCHQKVKSLLDNSQEVRETIRELNKKYLSLQLSIKYLSQFVEDIENKARDIETKLINEDFIQDNVQASFFASAHSVQPKKSEIIAKTNKNYPNEINLEKNELSLAILNETPICFEYRVI